MPARHAQVYQCTGPNGQKVFQQAPCDSGGQRLRFQPGNVVQTATAGDRQVIRDAQRSLRMRSAIESRQVVIGMTEDELIASWGQPSRVNTDTNGSGVSKQWIYERGGNGTQYVYTSNGVVTSTQTRPGIEPVRAERCYSEIEIHNARTEASSITLSYAEKQAKLDRIARMAPCR